MSDSAIRITLLIEGAADATPEEVDELARQLLQELRETEVESAELASGGPAPAGTKSVNPVLLGQLAVAVLPSFLPRLADLAQSWSQRGQGRRVKFKGTVAGQEVDFEGGGEDLKLVLAALTAAAPAAAPPPAVAGPPPATA